MLNWQFTFAFLNYIYECLAPRAEPEGKNRVSGTPSARQPNHNNLYQKIH